MKALRAGLTCGSADTSSTLLLGARRAGLACVEPVELRLRLGGSPAGPSDSEP